MLKLVIARRIHQAVGISEVEALKLLDKFFDFLKTTLHQGEPIVIQSFGKWTVRKKVARKGRNPWTGEAVTIAARRVVTFRPSAQLSQFCPGNKAETRTALS